MAHCLAACWKQGDTNVSFADPAVGTGSFYSAALQVFGPGRIASAVGIEVDPRFHAAANNLWASRGLQLVQGDFTEWIADRVGVNQPNLILANPPFGGKERKEVQQNFPIRTGETAFLFLQHFIKMLKAGGRAGVVIKNTFLSNTDNASVSLRKLLLESCNLHTVLDLPGGTFHGAGVKTVVLFFEKGAPTRKVWFYQLDPGRNLGKTNPLNDDDLAEFVELQKTHPDSPKSWSVDVTTVDQTTFDLSVKNPNGGEVINHRTPQEILDEIAELDAESAKVLERIRALL